MLSFVFPTYEHRNDVLDFYIEFEKNNETCIGYNNNKDFEKWLCEMHNRKIGKNLPNGYVRENFYLCYDNDEMVGVFSLKFELTQFLLNFGGHIGYAVIPSKRNNGLATKILEQGLNIAKTLSFEKILVVCDEDNYASEKVIIKNNGVFENKLFYEEEGVFVKRYWIYL